MKPIEKEELYNHLTGFLKTRGIELTDGSYANGIQKTCSLLADAINMGQQGFERAKTEFDKRLDQMRQVIHEKTAPKPPPTAQAAPPPQPAAPAEAGPSTQAASGPAGSTVKKDRARKARHSKRHK